MKQGLSVRTRVLFFAWGDSIHARRRIGIFCEDSAFEVGVVSTFPYDFENATNYYLSGVFQGETKGNKLLQILIRAGFTVTGGLLYFVMRFFGGATLAECSNFVRDVFLIRRYMNEFKPDVVFLQTLMYPCYLSYFWLNKTPMIVTFWNGDVTWWAKWTGIERAFKKKIVQHGARIAAAITVNSRSAWNACVGYGVIEEKVRLIRYPGVDLQMFKPCLNRMAVREQLGIASECRVVICPRGLGGYLNSDIIIEAAAQVIKRFPNTQFLFPVRDDARQEWDLHLKRAGELGVVSNVVAIDHIPWKNMPSYYQAADVVVSISSNDSLPNCMLEAMACGVPVIMGDIPQIKEWVTDGENGYCIPPRDPTALANRIELILGNRDGVVELFVERNTERIHREVDSRVMALSVKRLVYKVARDFDCSESITRSE